MNPVLEVTEHAREYNWKGDIGPLKTLLREIGYIVVDSGVEGYELIFDKNVNASKDPSQKNEGQIDYRKKRLVVFSSTRLQRVIDECTGFEPGAATASVTSGYPVLGRIQTPRAIAAGESNI